MKRKNWFEKIDVTSSLPNFYPYCEDSADTNQPDSESIHSIFENSENVVTLNGWTSDDQKAV
ncbi:MAG: hypothetical protein DKT66_05965 [Candidatus Melainabacteria bacterium]|nr:MAG: hypothetical protein DKT66_05965 [Candidatus Melainabacteria bacterium]